LLLYPHTYEKIQVAIVNIVLQCVQKEKLEGKEVLIPAAIDISEVMRTVFSYLYWMFVFIGSGHKINYRVYTQHTL